MSKFFSDFEIDPESFEWKDLAACNNMPLGLFFEQYESDKVIAREVDRKCLNCPVQRECYEAGREGKETGVWGGLYLSNGVVDRIKNKHKTPEMVQAIAERIAND